MTSARDAGVIHTNNINVITLHTKRMLWPLICTVIDMSSFAGVFSLHWQFRNHFVHFRQPLAMPGDRGLQERERLNVQARGL